jgi:hypothetical protein
MGDGMQHGDIASVDELLTIAAKHGQVISTLKIGSLELTMIPKELAIPPDLKDPKAPKEMPDSFDELPLPQNWQDPAEKANTEETRKRAERAQELADEEVFGAKIPNQD